MNSLLFQTNESLDETSKVGTAKDITFLVKKDLLHSMNCEKTLPHKTRRILRLTVACVCICPIVRCRFIFILISSPCSNIAVLIPYR